MKRSLILFAMACGMPVCAQIPSSTSEIHDNGGAQAAVEGARELRRLGGCAVRLNPGYARNLLDTIPASDAEGRVAYTIGKVIENCMNGYPSAIRLTPAALRGTVAETFYLAAHPSPPDFAAFGKPSSALPAGWLAAKLAPAQVSEIISQDFAQCVAAADPSDSDALIRTEPRSPAESGVVRRLQPQLGPCLMQGRSYKMDAAALRSYVAQALYRQRAAPALASAGGR